MVSWTDTLEASRLEILGYAREAGLTFPEVIFELITSKQVNEVAALGGFPTRYPHWKFGMQYDQLEKSYTYGLSKIYEMVINTDPVYAYLMDSNNLVDQKLVMAHVFGHADFFTNNLYFQHTNRKMIDETANHAVKVSRYIDRLGIDKVEGFIDSCLSLENLLDYHAPLRGIITPGSRDQREDGAPDQPGKLPSKNYMDSYINPPEFLTSQQKWGEEQAERLQLFPRKPQDDLLLFLLENAPLERWQQEILAMLRKEAYYFLPQGQTKIMNEGWATFWHSRIMTTRVIDSSEVIDFADHHSGTVAMAPGQFNPYKVGLELFRDIEDRWNRGAHGPEYDQCQDIETRRGWDRQENRGLDKIFEVRKLYNDINFIDTFFTEDFCARQKMFTFRYNPRSNEYEVASRDFHRIKRQFLFSLTRMGNPWIQVIGDNGDNRGELQLLHRHEGLDLEPVYVEATMSNLAKLWHRPVQMVTVVGEKPVLIRHDGKGLEQKELQSS